jgi:hypothetical protein
MEEIWMVLFRANVYLLVFAGGYFLLIRNTPVPVFSRFFILGSFLFSLFLALLPSVPVSYAANAAARDQVVMLPELIVRAGAGTSQLSSTMAGFLGQAGLHRFFIWAIGGMLIFSTLVKLFRIGLLIRSNPVVERDQMRLVLLGRGDSPFSFFHYVFVPSAMIDQDCFPRVLAHERAHYLRGHSWDMLLLECVRVLFWFNPAFYYLRKGLKAQHEFEADMMACRTIPKADYQMTLLDLTISGTLVPLTNPFNVSLIKKRIMMMNQKIKKPTAGLWLKTMLLLPFLLLAVAVQSCQEKSKDELAAETALDNELAVSGNLEDAVFTVVETPPAFPGGEEARVRYLQENLRYPSEAREAGAQGTVFVSFVVRSDGSINDVKVLRGADHDLEVRYEGADVDLQALREACEKLDKEAVRVVSSMPEWVAGQQRGEAVNVQFNMPIRFALNVDRNHAVITID